MLPIPSIQSILFVLPTVSFNSLVLWHGNSLQRTLLVGSLAVAMYFFQSLGFVGALLLTFVLFEIGLRALFLCLLAGL